MSKRVLEDGANLRAAKGLAKIIAVAIILTVAAFGDVMYIQAMSSKFPSGGPLLIMCYIGAFTSFLSVLYLLMGKSLAFRPGAQMIGAWVVFIAELLIIGMNILLVFNPSSDGLMGAWASISPASPVLHMLGVALLYFLDPDLKSKHDAMEMQEKMDKSEREVGFEVFNARIALRRMQVEHVSKALEQAVHSPESLSYIQEYGHTLNRDLLTELTGRSMLSSGAPAAPGLPAPGVVSGSLAPGGSDALEWDANERYLKGINDRMAAERERRLMAGMGGGDPETDEYQPVNYDMERLARLAEGASTQGYSLDDLERVVGLSPSAGLDRDARLVRLASAAEAKGYTLEKLERFLGGSALQGGDAEKKK